MKHNHFRLNLFVAGMLLGVPAFSAAPALALETGCSGPTEQTLAGDYALQKASPTGRGWGGTFGSENPAGEADVFAKPKPPSTDNNGWGGTFAGQDISIFWPAVYHGMIKVY